MPSQIQTMSDAEPTTETEAETDRVEEAVEFLHNYYHEEVLTLAHLYPSEQRSLYIDYDDLFQYDPEWAETFESHPSRQRELLERALARYDHPGTTDLEGANVRIHNLPESYDVDEVSRHTHVGTMLDVDGQVAKVSKVKPRVEEAVFKCLRCGSPTPVPQHGEELRRPNGCDSCERDGPWRFVPEQGEWTDHQYARIQQPPERTQGGDGATVDVHLVDDLVDDISTGDRLTLTCRVDLEAPGKNQSRSFDTELAGEAVQIEESDYEDIDVDEHMEEIEAIANGERGDPYDLLVGSVNPAHHGDETLKLAIVLQMFGGWAHHYPDGSRDRGDIHVLMIGEPGCGKSTFLQWTDEVAPRSTYASGKGATAAGLTAAAVPDNFGDAEWSLEAGALVLADGGVACVDEIDKVDGEALSSMHEALESQQVHVDKAGIHADLNTRAALLAAGNPEQGRFSPNRPRGEQIDLGAALLSRFDLIFLVSDDPDPERDDAVVEHMIRSRRASGRFTRDEELTDEDRDRIEPDIDSEVLRAYVAHARRECQPLLESDAVEQRVRDYIVEFRRQAEGEDSPIPVTFRHVEAVQRLAEASARVRLDGTITDEDIERAIKLLETSMGQVGIDPDSGQFDADIVETGQSTSQRERREKIRSWIRTEDEFTTGDMRSFFDREGIDTAYLQAELEWLLNKGLVYEPEEDRFRPT